ncbi:hypothetical protein DTL42_24405 [Bremerella cremea]|uniref:Uncharacterized protein n=1 Tax=Bremerella cremea TaxID=1031537 RepID=A0A368KJ39_9BACT|nr:hypothetical protein DTL42_24405 [Bremerella cremea]
MGYGIGQTSPIRALGQRRPTASLGELKQVALRFDGAEAKKPRLPSFGDFAITDLRLRQNECSSYQIK